MRGRDLAETDRLGQPGAVLVNEAMAARYFPGEDPIGRHILRQLVGAGDAAVVGDRGRGGNVRTGSLENAPEEAIYYPVAQVAFAGMTVLARTSGDPLSLATDLRAAVRGLDPQLPLARVLSMDQVLARSLGARHFYATVLGAVRGPRAAPRRPRDLRRALLRGGAARARDRGARGLGARARRRGDAHRAPGRGGRRAGLAAGLAGAALLSGVMRGLLFEVQALDPSTLAAVVSAVALCSVLASALPLRRALAVDPAAALRGE